MTIPDILTLLIAAWGAILATALAVIEWRRRKPRVRVILDEVRFQDLDGNTKRTFWIRAMNWGEKSVTLDDLVISWERGCLGPFYDESGKPVSLPHELQPGNRYEVRFDAASVTESLRKRGKPEVVSLRAVFSDPLGRRYASESHDFSLNWDGTTE